MPCYHPLQASFVVRSDGKKDIKFSNSLAKSFYLGFEFVDPDSSLSIPCGKCVGCRLERSRQWAVRCTHEAEMWEDNCFITLTYAPEFLPSNGSLSKEVPVLFLKRLRQAIIPKEYLSRKMVSIRKQWVQDHPLRVLYCGEYGEECALCFRSRKFCVCTNFKKQLGRPHYHMCLFNYDFPDKEYFTTVGGFKYFTSKLLSSVWSDVDSGESLGFCTVGDFSFETAAYVARYVVDKVTGDLADSHYEKLLLSGDVVKVIPEFAQASRRPGLGRFWIEKHGFTDVFPHDCVIARGVKCKPPRYYDDFLCKVDPEAFLRMKQARDVASDINKNDCSYKRLLVREKCHSARIKLLIRSLED